MAELKKARAGAEIDRIAGLIVDAEEKLRAIKEQTRPAPVTDEDAYDAQFIGDEDARAAAEVIKAMLLAMGCANLVRIWNDL
jgi:hypothetical protein